MIINITLPPPPLPLMNQNITVDKNFDSIVEEITAGRPEFMVSQSSWLARVHG